MKCENDLMMLGDICTIEYIFNSYNMSKFTKLRYEPDQTLRLVGIRSFLNKIFEEMHINGRVRSKYKNFIYDLFEGYITKAQLHNWFSYRKYKYNRGY